MTQKSTRRGFTLIELLVVVLIISILAAVAVPQYRLAINKSRYVQLMELGDRVWEAQQVYYLANGQYADSFQKLDITLPNQKGNDTRSVNSYSFGRCAISSDLKSIFCTMLEEALYFARDFNSKNRFCQAWPRSGNQNSARQVCLGMGGVYHSTGKVYQQESYLLP